MKAPFSMGLPFAREMDPIGRPHALSSSLLLLSFQARGVLAFVPIRVRQTLVVGHVVDKCNHRWSHFEIHG